MLQFFALSADILPFGFGLNDASGNGVWSGNISCQVYSANHTNGSAPVITSVPTTMSAANAGNGRYNQKINITGGAYRPNVWFTVYVHASVSGADITPTGALGSFIVTRGIRSNLIQMDGASASSEMSAVFDTAMDNIGVAISANLETRFTNVSAAVVAVSAAVAGTSAGLETHLVNISAGITNVSAAVVAVSAAVAGVSAAVAVVSAAIPTSAEISGVVLQALQDQNLHTLIQTSASTTSIHNNSIIGMILATAEPTDFARGTDSLAAIADGAGATPLTSAATSTIIGGALLNYDSPTAAEISTLSANLHTNIGSASAGLETHLVTISGAVAAVSGAVAAVSALIITSSETSGIVAQAVSDYDGPTGAEMVAMSANLHTNIGSASAAVAGVSAAVAAVSAQILTLSANLHTNIGSVSAAISARVVQAITDALPLAANIVQIRGGSAPAVTLEAVQSAMVVSSARAGTLTVTVMNTNLTSANFPDTDQFKGRLITFIGGTGLDRQQVEISAASTSSGFIVLTYSSATRAPAASQKFIVH